MHRRALARSPVLFPLDELGALLPQAARNLERNGAARTDMHRRALARSPVLFPLDEPGALLPQAARNLNLD
nr:hypothetical protein [Lujinxingiaceae bacterium]